MYRIDICHPETDQWEPWACYDPNTPAQPDRHRAQQEADRLTRALARDLPGTRFRVTPH